MIGNNLENNFMNRCRLEQIGGKTADPRRGFTLIELVLVLVILAILAGAAMSMVDTQVDQARFESTQQTLQDIGRAVLGPADARGADGTLAVSGFVADCGRLPFYLAELYQPVLEINGEKIYDHSDEANPIAFGDNDVFAKVGWNGPYLQKAMGADYFREGYGATLDVKNVTGTKIEQFAYDDDGKIVSLIKNEDAEGNPQEIGTIQSYGANQEENASDTGYDADLVEVFQDNSFNLWQKPLTVNVLYFDGDATTNPNPAKGDRILVRVYGPVAVQNSEGALTTVFGTIQQQVVQQLDPVSLIPVPKYLRPAPVSVTFSGLPIGPRIIRAYQLVNASILPSVDQELSDLVNLKTVSVPTRVVVSRETSSMQLILRDTTDDHARFRSPQEAAEAISRAVLGSEYARSSLPTLISTDGKRVVSGFVADCGRLPKSLEELHTKPSSLQVFTTGESDGDSEVIGNAGWNGPYLQPTIGSTSFPSDWSGGLTLLKSNGDPSSDGDDPVSILRFLGRDGVVGGTNQYDADYEWIFESDAEEQNNWKKNLIVDIAYRGPDWGDGDSEMIDPSKGDKVVVRVYGPTDDGSFGTIEQKILDLSGDPDLGSVTFSDSDDSALSIGPRIVRAYQLDGGSEPSEDDELSEDGNLTTVSMPTRCVVSSDNSSLALILRDKQ